MDFIELYRAYIYAASIAALIALGVAGHLLLDRWIRLRDRRIAAKEQRAIDTSLGTYALPIVRIPISDFEQLESLASKQRQPVQTYVRGLIQTHLQSEKAP